MAKQNGASKLTALGGETPSNGAAATIDATVPYVVRARLVGTVELLFHRWNCEAVDEKAGAAKGSKAKKTDDIATYVWRNEEGYICIPGEYVRQSVIHAAKSMQDPRSSRKSAMDLFKAGLISLTNLATLGVKEWDFIDKRRATVNRGGINRSRPAMHAGWKADFDLLVNIPEYITPAILHDRLSYAGRLVGIADFRPSYGRFQVSHFDIGLDAK